MSRFVRWSKVIVLLGTGGMLWMLGAGSCLPQNFYPTLLGDTIIGTFAATLAGSIAAGITLPGQGA